MLAQRIADLARAEPKQARRLPLHPAGGIHRLDEPRALIAFVQRLTGCDRITLLGCVSDQINSDDPPEFLVYRAEGQHRKFRPGP